MGFHNAESGLQASSEDDWTGKERRKCCRSHPAYACQFGSARRCSDIVDMAAPEATMAFSHPYINYNDSLLKTSEERVHEFEDVLRRKNQS